MKAGMVHLKSLIGVGFAEAMLKRPVMMTVRACRRTYVVVDDDSVNLDRWILGNSLRAYCTLELDDVRSRRQTDVKRSICGVPAGPAAGTEEYNFFNPDCTVEVDFIRGSILSLSDTPKRVAEGNARPALPCVVPVCRHVVYGPRDAGLGAAAVLDILHVPRTSVVGVAIIDLRLSGDSDVGARDRVEGDAVR